MPPGYQHRDSIVNIRNGATCLYPKSFKSQGFFPE